MKPTKLAYHCIVNCVKNEICVCNVNHTKNFIYFILGLFFLFGCQTTPKKTIESKDKIDTSKLQKFIWETKAQIRDLKRNKNNNVSIDFLAIKNYKLRLEIQAALGIQVGSLGMTQEQFVAILYTQKKVIQGKMNEQTLEKSFNLPIPPEALYAIAFDDTVKGPYWKCYFDLNKIVSLCENAMTLSKIEWKNRNQGAKLVKISSPEMEVDWFFKQPKPLEIKPETFNIEIPSGYKTINI